MIIYLLKMSLLTLILNFFFNPIQIDFKSDINKEKISSHKDDSLQNTDFYDGPHIKWLKNKSKIRITYFVKLVDHRFPKKYTEFVDVNDSVYCFKGKYGDTSSYTINKKLIPYNSIYKNVDQIFAVGDVHGEYEPLIKLLKNAHIVDEKLNWNFNKGHLIFMGDVLDRGDKSTETLWLIYKLEQQANKDGGRVHFLLGNHEVMAFFNDKRYLASKYLYFFHHFHIDNNYLFNKKTVLGEWLRKRPTLLKINDNIFVHAGISPTMQKLYYTPDHINELAISLIENYKPYNNLPVFNTFIGLQGPYWYRGYVKHMTGYDLINQDQVNEILKFYRSSRIIHAHTGVKSIKSSFDGKIFNVHVPFDTDDVIHQGLLIEGDTLYQVTVNGDKIIIENQ